MLSPSLSVAFSMSAMSLSSHSKILQRSFRSFTTLGQNSRLALKLLSSNVSTPESLEDCEHSFGETRGDAD